jgi:hypothetical protein
MVTKSFIKYSFFYNSFIRIILLTSCNIILLGILSGCNTLRDPSTSEAIFLQEIEVTGPINQPPIHLTDSLDAPIITLTPRFSYISQTSIRGQIERHTLVNEEGIFQVDTFYNNGDYTLKETTDANKYNFTGKNLTWNVASVYAALDLDYRMYRNFGVFLGINYSVQNRISTWGGTVGIGVFSASSRSAIRLDLGLNLQQIAYDANTVLVVHTFPTGQENDGDVLFIHDKDKSFQFDPFISVTYNTNHRDWFVNIFINAGYSGQTIVNFASKDESSKDLSGYRYNTFDLRGESTSGFFNFTPGIYFFVGESGRILFGTRFFFQTNDKSTKPSNFILPMVQFDFTI